MTPRVDIPAMTGEDRLECAKITAVPPVIDNRKIPIAYEEVILTEEAEEILEKERKAVTERPARKIRRMPIGESGTPRS
jgi:hypothetical protein